VSENGRTPSTHNIFFFLFFLFFFFFFLSFLAIDSFR